MTFTAPKISPSFCLVLVLAAGGATARTGGPGVQTADTPTSLSAQTPPSTLRHALYQALADDAGAAYRVGPNGCATLPESGLRACFDREGTHFFSAPGSRLGLRLIAWGRGSNLTPVQTVRPTIENNRVSYVHGALTEWWRILPIGFEQGFTLSRHPKGHGDLMLVLESSQEGNHHKAGLVWGRLRYGGLVVTDAQGKILPSTLNSEDKRILIAVNDRNASYPLTVDPLVWLEQKATASDGAAGDGFGGAATIAGSTALIGAPYALVNGHREQGAVYVFTRNNGAWQETDKLAASNGLASGHFGQSLALSGKRALIGAPGGYKGIFNPVPGAAYLFTRSENGWEQTATFTDDTTTKTGQFGYAVTLADHTALIGAPSAGMVYAFTETNSAWSQTAQLEATGSDTAGNLFGGSLALGDDLVIIGANSANINGNSAQGAVYVFSRSDGDWAQTQKLVANDGAGSDVFGIALALSGDRLLVGAPGAQVGDNRGEGAAYIFTHHNGAWSQTQKLIPADGAEGGGFGNAVALAGDTALIGAPAAKYYQGTAYVFRLGGGLWKEKIQLNASDQEAFSQFGSSLALSRTTAIVGANEATIGTNNTQGAAYFYGRSNLGVAISAPERINPDSTFVSSTIATNVASTTSPAVAVSIAVPAAASFVSATATQGECAKTAGIIRCRFGAIPGNAGKAQADITLKTPGTSGGSLASRAALLHATPSLSAGAATAVNHLPVANDGHLIANQGKSTSAKLKATDADGDALVFSIVTPPPHGKVTINDVHKGVYTYTPEAGYVGADNFSFRANDGYADSNVATIIVNIENQPPVAKNGSLTTDKNVAANGKLQASDPDDDPLVFSIVAPPGHGKVTLDSATGAYTYTPADGYFGDDSFSFKAGDGSSNSNVAVIDITVEGSAPPPPPPPSDNGGSGSLGGLLLALLVGLAGFAGRVRRGRRAREFDQPTAGYSYAKETFMRRNRTRIMSCGVLASALMLGSLPSMASAQPGGNMADVESESGYRAGLTMPLAATETLSQWVTLAAQSNLELLARATRLGPHAAQSKIKITVGLKLRHLQALETFLRQAQNPESPVYHEFLTPEQFTTRYGPAKSDVAQVVAFLEERGITITDISPNRTLIHTTATTEAYERAFRIRINDYRLDGRSFYSTTDRPRLPRALSPLVTNILGLNHGARMRPLHRVTMHYSGELRPEAAPPPATGYFNPHQIATAYDWPDIDDPAKGAGVTIAILTALTPNVGTNPNYHDFWDAFGLPDHTINVIPVGGASGTGGEGETALDIEWSAAMAPGATLNVYVAADSSFATFTDMYNRFVTDNNAEVMTTSWGLAEAGTPAVDTANEQIFMQAAAQGISMFAASGDFGASDCSTRPGGYCPPGPNNADFPSSSKYITAANGTELTISEVSGTYGNEHAWANTGGAISQLFEKPAWQTGPGVPTDIDMRMNSDVALNAGGLHPYLVLIDGPSGLGYYGISGTSAVAPILAGLFAIGVSGQPSDARLGQSNSLIYNAVNANDTNYASDFHDITEGCNGYLPDGTTQSCAKTNWDHPTGWGSPKATALLSDLGVHGPAGTLDGTVTDAESGMPVAGATVTATAADFSESRTTEDDGNYFLALEAGDYTVTVTAFGYNDASDSVSIGDGDSVTQDFALAEAPKTTLSGTVTDNSGHGYGLYARITASVDGFGQVATIWTDPATGHYSTDLPKGFDYTLNVIAAFNGYESADATVSLQQEKTQNFGLKVTEACTAPGYANPFSEDFNTEWPAAGWTITNTVDGSLVYWQPNINWGSDNWTGGTGLAAEAASGGAAPDYYGPYDTALVTPPIAASAVRANPVLQYKANYQPAGVMQKLDLDISTDGGDNWTTLLHWIQDTCGGYGRLPGCQVSVDLGPHLPAQGNFQLRWHYYDHNQYAFDRYAQIDDVRVGACQAVAGGLVFGQVTDANTGEGITWASVADDLGNNVDTTSNPADPGFPLGGYLLFVPTGERTVTASNYRYQDASAPFVMPNDAIKVQDFALKAGKLTSDPGAFNLHVMVNNQVTRSFTVKNTGSGQAGFDILSVNAPPPTTSEGAGAPRMTIEGDFSPLRLTASRIENQVRPRTNLQPRAAPWTDIADYPVAVMDNAAAVNPTTGVIYSVDGVHGVDFYDTVYAYHPATNAWELATHNEIPRGAPQVAFIDGRLYVVGGWLSTGGQAPQLEIYDPATDRWIRGADIPNAWAGAGHAVVNGKLYIIGGCGDDCLTADVQVYDPAEDAWSRVQDYPHPVAWLACGGVDGKLYCAGGTSDQSQLYKDGYVYDPATNQWSPIRDMPIRLWGSAYASTNGLLLVVGGVSGFNTLTNASYAYDPVTNSWHNIPNVNHPLFRGGSACGFYRIGGAQGGSQPAAIADRLPGYSQCGKPAPLPWLTASPATGSLAAGDDVEARLIFDGSGQEEFTTSRAYLKLRGNTPYPDRIAPLTVTWDPQPVNLVLKGSISPNPVRKGNALSYTITIYSRQADNHGAATKVRLEYALPDGISYEAASGDATSCTVADGTVTCGFDTIPLGSTKTEILAVKSVDAGKLTGNFKVSAREPDSDSSDNSLSLTSLIIGTSDLVLTAGKASIPVGGTGNLTLTLKNTGPDPAAEVHIHAKEDGIVRAQTATASQGHCSQSDGTLSCELGQVNAGDTVSVTLELFGRSEGSTTVNAQASTASEEHDNTNNSVSATVTVKAAPQPDNGGDGGGGALGWLVLASLLGLALSRACLRGRT